MRPLELSDIAGLEEYEGLRDAYREAVIAHKKPRRVPVGDKVTLVFEDRETLRFQVQEMLRIERTSRHEDVQHELDTYNELLPREGELSATLFIEITEQEHIREELDRLLGIDEHVFLTLGEPPDERVHARFDPKQLEEDRISAVQYVRFCLAPAQRERFADVRQPAALEIDHPAYRARAPLTAATRESLVATCAGHSPELLPRSPAAAAAEALPEGERVRVRQAPDGAIVVEALEPSARLESADPNLAAELWGAIQQAARSIVARGQRCDIASSAGDEAPGIRFVLRPR